MKTIRDFLIWWFGLPTDAEHKAALAEVGRLLEEAKGKLEAKPAEDRLVFSYWDGEEHRQADPFEIWRGLFHSKDVDFLGSMKAVSEPIPEGDDQPEDAKKMYYEAREEARDEIIKLARQVFKLKKFDDGGLTVNEIFGLVEEFWSFNKGIKKKRDQQQTPQPSTESE